MGPAGIDGAREQRNSLELLGHHLRHYFHHPESQFHFKGDRAAGAGLQANRFETADRPCPCLLELGLLFSPVANGKLGRKPTLQEAVFRSDRVRVRAAALSSDRTHCPICCRIRVYNRPCGRLADTLGFLAMFGITLASGAVALALLVFWVDEPRMTTPLTIEEGERRGAVG